MPALAAVLEAKAAEAVLVTPQGVLGPSSCDEPGVVAPSDDSSYSAVSLSLLHSALSADGQCTRSLRNSSSETRFLEKR